MLRAIAIFTCQIVSKILWLFHRNGSVLPGAIAYKIDRHVLEKITLPKYVIGVTGSSGKGTTTNLINHVLTDAGLDVVYNQSGSNIINAIVTLVLNNCNLKGVFKHEVLLLELDEKHMHLAFNKNQLTHLVITNITRDQPARNGSPDLVLQSILQSLDKKTTLIINGDDPGLMRLKYIYKGKIVTYGLDKHSEILKNPLNNTIDFAYCPLCHHKLHYDFYHYGHLGSYHCPNCEFNRKPLNYLAKNLDLKKQEMEINKTKINLNKNILYTAYATLATYALCKTVDIDDQKIIHALNIKPNESKRAHEYKLDNRKIIMLESKNENALSYYQSLKYIKDDPEKKCVLLGFENVSRRYKENDLSWLWDVDFELLNDPNITNIVLIGRFKYDVATRLSYADIDMKKIIFIDNLDDIISTLKKKTKNKIYTMVCFDMTEIILQQLKEEE